VSGLPYIKPTTIMIASLELPAAAAARKYHLRTALFMGGYIAVNTAAITGAFDNMRPPGTWAFALVVAAPVIGQIGSLLAWMRDSDEFVRGLAAKRFIVAAGIALALSSAWGFMELYAGAPHLSAALVFPLFCVAFGMVTPLIRSTN
jgi:hypothetical protein